MASQIVVFELNSEYFGIGAVESTPVIATSIDSAFIKGNVRLDTKKAQRLVILLDLAQVLTTNPNDKTNSYSLNTKAQ